MNSCEANAFIKSFKVPKTKNIHEFVNWISNKPRAINAITNMLSRFMTSLLETWDHPVSAIVGLVFVLSWLFVLCALIFNRESWRKDRKITKKNHNLVSNFIFMANSKPQIRRLLRCIIFNGKLKWTHFELISFHVESTLRCNSFQVRHELNYISDFKNDGFRNLSNFKDEGHKI